jgi:hypothetical protein
MRNVREAIPQERRIDVGYADMERDWQGVMRDIYRFLDMDIAPALPAMEGYVADSDRTLERYPHRYSLEAFGLDRHEVTERFESYIDGFELARLRSVPAAWPIELAAAPQMAARDGWRQRRPARVAAARR